jgi:hypothetical protein
MFLTPCLSNKTKEINIRQKRSSVLSKRTHFSAQLNDIFPILNDEFEMVESICEHHARGADSATHVDNDTVGWERSPIEA